MTIRIEICLDSVESARAALAGGADRVELCDDLLEGGTTPSHGMIAVVRETVAIDVCVLVRPRGGDFCYAESELEVMRRDIDVAGELGAAAVVLGVLEPAGRIDRRRTRDLIERARPMQVTFHRAFDWSRDPIEALDDLLDLGADRLLTSGQAATAFEGIDLLARLVERAGDRCAILAGGGVSAQNAAAILRGCRARELHASSGVTVPVAPRSARPGVAERGSRPAIGGRGTEDQTVRRQVSAAAVRELARAARTAGAAPP